MEAIPHKHLDFVHGISHNFFGDRISTCSSDRNIHIWARDEDDNQWKFENEIKGHNGSIWKVDWGHPEFGNVVVSCSTDQSIRIWEGF
jgi:WD40 repeat protein